MKQSVCWASKKAGTTSRNKRKNTPGKARGWKKYEGDYVEPGMILFRQLGLKVYPGENVSLEENLEYVLDHQSENMYFAIVGIFCQIRKLLDIWNCSHTGFFAAISIGLCLINIFPTLFIDP